MLFIQLRNHFRYFVFHFRIICRLNIGKTHKYYRKRSLKLSVFVISFRGLVFPYKESFKQIRSSSIFIWEKTFNHTHIECFSKSSWTGNQRNIWARFPPFLYQPCLIYIEWILFPYPVKSLYSNVYIWFIVHDTPPSINCIISVWCIKHNIFLL